MNPGKKRPKCNKCHVLMVTGKALKNTVRCYDDFGGDAGQRGTTCDEGGTPEMKRVWKCPECGHSFTK